MLITPGIVAPGAPGAPGAPLPGGGVGGGGFFTTLSRSTPSKSSSRALSTRPARDRLRSWTQYELPSAITSITVGAAVDVPAALRSIVIVAVGLDASRLGSAGAVISRPATMPTS